LVKGSAAAVELTASQERIIDVLRKLLDVIRHAQADLLAGMKKRPGGNLPDDVKEKLAEFSAKLDKFLREQKKVVEASENLAKTPVDDFSKQQEELLKGLAAAEDQLSKLMQELQSDLSKLPEQDFANASVAKELVEIQTELKMAEDALLKKSVDIAVPLEQFAYERAEELKTNLEKWLPDSPDREKWSQE
jgi:DNA repair exonuclease SbcCD ATPase subunit